MMRKLVLSAAVALALSTSAYAQQFNIDLSTTTGDSAPAPDAAYAGAAGQAGAWNNITDAAAAGAALFDIANAATAATISLDGGFMGAFTGANSDATIAGSNAELLLDDGWDPSGLDGVITVSGLLPGTYSVYLYGLAPDSVTDLTQFSVNGSVEGGFVNVGGAIGPADSFLDTYLVPTTHAIFTKTIGVAEDLIINVGNRGGEFETVNGIQIVIPEPGSICLLGLGALAMFRRRR